MWKRSAFVYAGRKAGLLIQASDAKVADFKVVSVRISDFFSGDVCEYGFSDLFGFRKDGQIFFIEVKNETGRVRPEQKQFLETMRSFGALAGVARSPEEALEIVNGHSKHK